MNEKQHSFLETILEEGCKLTNANNKNTEVNNEQ